MSSQADRVAPAVITAVLTAGAARVAHGMTQCTALVEEILTLDHADHETDLPEAFLTFNGDTGDALLE
jgi:hypothetical protein